MKRILFLFMTIAVVTIAAMAVPAKPGIHTLTQPDGTTLQARLLGDEWHHSYVTADGYTIRQAEDGAYRYVTAEGVSDVQAHDAASRDAAELSYLEANKDRLTMSALYQTKVASGKMRSRAKAGPAKAPEVPTSGSPKIPVLLIQYSNVSMKHTKAQFEQHYNTQTWSVLKYFTDQSNGQFTPQFDVYGIYTLNSTRATYGGNNTSGDDKGVGTMVAEAISKAGTAIDWSQYDNDGDGYVDACIVVYAGPGESSGAAAETIWPCQWYLSSATGSAVTRNGKKIDKFAVFCELSGSSDSGTTLDGVGTFCHEFSHCLGLPDFYPTDSSNHFGMGDWSLLHAGCYNGNGDRPCGYTAYERNFMGWMNLSTPVEGQTYTIASVDAGGPAYKITSGNANEYYILENIQKTGWNQYARSSGLLVNHVNYNATTWNDNTVNNSSVQGMTIIPADNSLAMAYQSGYGYYHVESDEVGDLYPYNGNNKLTSNSTPAATLYNSSTNLNKPITDITNSGNNVSFTYMGADAMEETGGTASDAYLNIAKYATIGEAGTQTTGGWNATYVNNLYKYTEDAANKVAWLTMPVYGAWASVYYAPKAQKWMATSYNQSPGTSAMGSESWNQNGVFKGGSAYFTSTTAKYFGNTSPTASAARTMTFNVKNVTSVKLLGKNAGGNSNVGNNRRCTVKVYKCTDNGNGTITPSTTVFKTATGDNNASGEVNLTIDGLSETDIYQVVVSTTRTHVYEIAFQTPIKTLPGVPTDVEADPTSTTADITWTPGTDNEDWNLRYREYVEGAGGGESTLWDLPVDSYQTQMADFSVHDADGDDDIWGLIYTNDAQTDLCFASFSYDSDTQTDLTPDNWLFTPSVTLGGTLKFKGAVASVNYPDKVGVYVFPDDDENYYKLGDVTPSSAFPTFAEYEFDLSQYEGTGQIAFRHYDSDGMYAILLDDIEVITAGVPEGEWIYVNSVTSPNTIEGLTPETTYEVQVQGVNGDGVSDWTASTIFTTLPGIGTPTIVSAEPTTTTSEVTWTAGDQNVDWNLRYREYVEGAGGGESTLWDLPLDSYQTQMADFSVRDADGDGNNWGVTYFDEEQTNICFYSESYDGTNDLTPDNWLYTREVELGGTLKFKAALGQLNWPDKIGVYVLPTDDEYYYHLGDVTPQTESLVEYQFDLSQYQGMGQIAFRHYDSDGNVAILLDDIEVITAGAPEGEWIYVNNVTSPYTITGLTPETTYEVQVQGVGDGGYTSAWTPSTLFTTLGVEEVTLATLEGQRDPGATYTISDQLLVVRASGNKLWAKDANLSIVRRDKPEGQIDYMREVAASGTYAINNMDVTVLNQEGEWDQSNWVVIEFLNSEMTPAVLADYEGKYITSVTGIYSDGENYTIQVPASTDKNTVDSWIGEVATPAFTPNVYCAANFLSSNLTDAGVTSPHGKVYFFMTPKVQEVFTVTYAVYAGNNKFTLPASEHGMNAAGLHGAFTVDMSYNGGTADLVVGQAYQFTAVASKPVTGGSGAPRKINGTGDDADGSFVVMPLDLSGNGNIVTKVGDVKVASREVVGVQYVNAAGISASKPFDGVNMVVTRYSDGSTTVEKRVF